MLHKFQVDHTVVQHCVHPQCSTRPVPSLITITCFTHPSPPSSCLVLLFSYTYFAYPIQFLVKTHAGVEIGVSYCNIHYIELTLSCSSESQNSSFDGSWPLDNTCLNCVGPLSCQLFWWIQYSNVMYFPYDFLKNTTCSYFAVRIQYIIYIYIHIKWVLIDSVIIRLPGNHRPLVKFWGS